MVLIYVYLCIRFLTVVWCIVLEGKTLSIKYNVS